jgi:hypothetical protein
VAFSVGLRVTSAAFGLPFLGGERAVSAAVLFLDVDGVLNNEGVFRDRRFGPFPLDHECIRRLHEVVEATDCQVVLSSSWRGGPHLERKLEADFVFEHYRNPATPESELVNSRHVDGSTKRLRGKRGEEIAEWLSRHPEVSRYAIVDDDSDMLPEQLPAFVQTSVETGLTDEHVKRLVAVLTS